MPFSKRLLYLLIASCLLPFAVLSADEDGVVAVDTAAEADLAAQQDQIAQAWNANGRMLITEFCIDCHNKDFQEAELDLETGLEASEMFAQRGHWEKILQRVRFGSMPPEDSAQPTDQQRTALVTSIEEVIYGSGCDLDPKPGRVTVHRLNRAEYNNTIRDIFGQDLRPADAFPSDEVGAGFDNNSDVLSLPPMLFEKYMAAAESVAGKVVLDPDNIEKIKVERSSDLLFSVGERKVGSFYKFYMQSDGVVWCEFDAPLTGRYRLRVDGSAGKEGEDVRLGVYDTEGKLLGTCKLSYADGGGSDSDRLDVELTAGKHRFFVALLNDALLDDGNLLDGGELPRGTLQAAKDLSDEDIENARQSVGKSLEVDRKFDRESIAFAVKRLTLEGPIRTPDYLYPPAHKKLVAKRPDKKTSVREAAKPGMSWLLRRAFREPVDQETLESYLGLVEQAERREESFERAMRVGVAAVLVSPRFLFRVELPPADSKPGEKIALNDFQLATRLSYFLWSSTPDEELLELAEQGKLINDEVLRQQVTRMLNDDRSEALADNFASQWLGLRNLESVQPDGNQFKEFSPSLVESMREETRLLFLDMLKSNRSIVDMLDSDETFVNKELAELYGLTEVQGDGFQRVSLEGVPRRGILTHASVLTLTSNPTRTSPVKRGKWILENVLGTPPPEPPAGVPELEETGKANPDAPVREQLEIHRADPACASCHRVMDDLGFGFENFDAIGKFRKLDGKFAVDASGELPGGLEFDGAVELIGILKTKYGTQFAETFTGKLMTFALGRELRFEDRCVISDIIDKTGRDQFRLRDLVTEVVTSPLFRYQQPEGR